MKRRGFSLAEALITLALVAVALGLVANLMGNVNKVERQADQKDRRLALVLHCLEMMRGEVAEAIEITTTSLPAAEFSFRKFNPNTDETLNSEPAPEVRLPASPPSPDPYADVPPPWDAHNGNHIMTVRYFLAGNALFRETRLNLAAPETTALCDGVQGFSVTRDNFGVLVLSVSVPERGQLHVYSSAVASSIQ